jgi:hypothetical protein
MARSYREVPVKRFLAALGLAAACVAFGFAEEEATSVTAKFSLNLLTGASYSSGNNSFVIGDSDAWGQDSTVSRLDLKCDFSYWEVGAKFTLREQVIGVKSYASAEAAASGAASVSYVGYPYVRRAFVYANLLDKKLHLELGLPGYGAFATSYNGFAAMDNNLSGCVLSAKPIEGLEIGCMLPVSPTAADMYGQFLASTLAISYSIPGILAAQAWVRQFDDIAVVGDLSLTAVKGLTLSVEAAYNDAVDYSADSLWFTEQVSYPFGKARPILVSTQGIGLASSALAFGAYPTLVYALADRLYAGVDCRFDYAADTISSLFDAFVMYDFSKGYLKLRPGYNLADGKGFFLAFVVAATL